MAKVDLARHTSATWRAALCSLCLLSLSACGGGGSGAAISTAPSSLSFSSSLGGAPQTELVEAQYKGSGVVVGYAPGVSPPAWLTVQQNGITTPSSATFALTVNPFNLAPGTYSTKVRFASGTVPVGGSIENASGVVTSDLPVTLTIFNFALYPSQAELALPEGATAPSTATFYLSADSGARWTAVSDQSWLTLARSSGNGPMDIEYAVAPAGLVVGFYTGKITVADNKGHSQVFTVRVSVAPPRLAIVPTDLGFNISSDTSLAARTQMITVLDQLGGQVPARALSWSVSSINVPWLSMSPTSGSSVPPKQASVSVSAESLAALANGNYTGNISLRYVTADGSVQSLVVPVTLNLDSPLLSIAVTPAVSGSAAIAQGSKVSFRAVGAYAAGFHQELTQQVRWASSDTAMATVSNEPGTMGTAQPLLPGSPVISASLPGSSVQGSTTFPIVAATSVAYVVNDYYDPKISQFVSGPDGVLQPMATPSATAGSRPQSITFSSDGKFAYVVHGEYISTGQFGLSQFTVDAGGALKPMTTPTVSLGSYAPQALTIDSSGRHVYVATCCASNTSILRLDIGPNGALTLDTKPPIPAAEYSLSIAANPVGPYLYVPDSHRNQINQFVIGSDGTLAGPTTAMAATGIFPNAMALHPSGKHAYVANFTDSATPITMSQYDVGSDGALVPMSPSTVTAGPRPRRIVMAPSGKTAYVVFDGGQQYSDPNNSGVATFSIDSKGHLIPQFSYNFAYARKAAIDPTEKFLYLTTGFNTVLQLSIGSDGTLVQSSHVVTTSDPGAIVVRRPPVSP